MTVEEKELTKIREQLVKDMTANTNTNGEVKILAGNELPGYIKSNQFAIVDFYATWCPPCKIMDPITKELAMIYKDKVAFAKINTDQERQVAMEYQIRYVPTFYLFKDGNVIGQFSGAKKKKDFMEIVDKQFKD